MTKYTLYNKKLDRKLKHPAYGFWYTTDLEDAKRALQEFYDLLKLRNLYALKDDFVIIDEETMEEI
jgi:hypothetical protein